MRYKVLIVEDELEIVTLLSNRLDKQKYDVTIATDGNSALKLIKAEDFDLISLDIMLPNIDGLTLCDAIRKDNKESLIVIISALDLDESKEKAYSLGADDYIAKPFSPKLVALKIDSLLKRRFELIHTQMDVNRSVQYDNTLKRFYIENRQLLLTPSEHVLFETLFLNNRRTFSKDELSQILYDHDIGNIDRDGIRTHIYTLRKKIANYTDEEVIKTIRGMGFTLYEN